jgi:6-phosphogluconolactonase
MMKSEQQLRWQCFSSAERLVDSLYSDLVSLAGHCIRERGAFHIVLAGGNTPQLLYLRLRQLDTDWSRWHFWFGDERCLPAGDPERNDVMAREAWLNHVPVLPGHIHAIPAELGAEAAAAAYSMELGVQDDFDLVLLGLGEDGHTASLFPGHELGIDSGAADAMPVFGAPKPPPERVTLSVNRLARSRHVWFIVTGETKSEALRNWRDSARIPAASIVPDTAVEVYTDCCEEPS